MNNENAYERLPQDCRIGSQTIRGVLFRPRTEQKVPLVICAHGYSGNYHTVEEYAEALAASGLAAYAFDFRGGGWESSSDGATTDMSVMTETADLEAVVRAAEGWTFADEKQIVLLGASQGGYVSAVAAARLQGRIAALILLYPAFVAGDDMHQAFASLDEIPEQLDYRHFHIGRKYFEDLWDYDPYSEIGQYRGPVLIIHGDADPIVPLSYSERAQAVYPDAVLKVIPGAGHGFSGADMQTSVDDIETFLKRCGILH